MNPNLAKLQPYPFQRLAELKQGLTPPTELVHIALSIGEPKHPTPKFISDAVIENISALSNYPTTKGTPELRQAIADWLIKRFSLPKDSVDSEQHILPVNGTREALFAFAQAVINPSQEAVAVLPNPFYQIYEGAILLAGAKQQFVNCSQDNNWLADFSKIPAQSWKKCQLLYICSPGNPTGAVIPIETLQELIKLADKYDFVIAADECYSEIYFDEGNKPVSLLQAAAEMGRTDYQRCVIFHSLSKRSNAPGLRSGFVAGDKNIIADFLLYRTYHGCAMPVHHQVASTAAWSDEKHVVENRKLYKEKFKDVIEILNPITEVNQPEAGFYLWLEVPSIFENDVAFAKELYEQKNVTVLPGSYLSRNSNNKNPGARWIRMALVATNEECKDAAKRIYDFIEKSKEKK